MQDQPKKEYPTVKKGSYPSYTEASQFSQPAQSQSTHAKKKSKDLMTTPKIQQFSQRESTERGSQLAQTSKKENFLQKLEDQQQPVSQSTPSQQAQPQEGPVQSNQETDHQSQQPQSQQPQQPQQQQ